MRSRTRLLLAGVAALAAALILLRPGTPREAGASVFSGASDGWLAARRYLERRGTRTTPLETPLDRAPEGSPLVLGFPWRRLPAAAETEALRRRLAAGRTVVFAYSGSAGFAEEILANALGIEMERVRRDPPLTPRAWYRFVRAPWRAAPDPRLSAAAGPIVFRAPRRLPAAPAGARVLYRAEGGRPVAFLWPRGRGRLLVLPADAFANSRIAEPGNADLLETLRAALGPEAAFDEYHHGLGAAGAEAAARGSRGFDLLLVQLFALYGLVAWALGRRFGAPWREPTPIAGSTSTFLLGLAAFHRKLRHASGAVRRLSEKARLLDPRLAAPGRLPEPEDLGEDGLLEYAREVAAALRGVRS